MLARNSLLAGLQAVIASLTLFATYHLVSRRIGIEALGFWSIAAALSSLAGAADCGVPDATVRQVAESRARSSAEWSRVVVTAVMFVGLILALACALAWPAVAWGLRHLFVDMDVADSQLFAAGALIVTWCVGCSTTIQGAVEGLERYDVRFLASIVANALALAVVFSLIDSHGAAGFVAGLVVQALVNLIVMGTFVVIQARRVGPMTPTAAHLRRLVAVGLPLRISSLSYYAFEPLTRVLVARFGGAEMAGIFEGAARFVGQARLVIVSGSQAMVPRLTAMHASSDPEFAEMVRRVADRVGFVSLVTMTFVVLLLPAASLVIVARVDSNFLLIGVIMAVGWFLNLRSVPAYFANLAQRRLKWNLFSHIALGAVNLLLGVALGMAFGPVGVAIATAVAIGVSSYLVRWSRGFESETAARVGGQQRWLVIISGSFVVVMLIVASLGARQPYWLLWCSTGAAIVYALHAASRLGSVLRD